MCSATATTAVKALQIPREALAELAATDTLTWLKGKSADQPPMASQDTRYSMAVRTTALQARKLTLPSIYVEAARLEQLYYP